MRKEDYIIKTFDGFNSGGNIEIFYGQLENKLYYCHSQMGEEVRIYDKEPFTEEYYEDSYEWEKHHCIAKFSSDSEIGYWLFEQMSDQFKKEPRKFIHYYYEFYFEEILNNASKIKELNC